MTKPKRVLLMAVGSRGDAEPFCALAHELAAGGATVDLLLQTDLLHLAPAAASNGTVSSYIHVHSFPFTQSDFLNIAGNPKHGVDDPNPRVKFIGILAEIVGSLVLPRVDQVHHLAANATAMVVSSLARPLGLVVAKKLQIPLYIIHLQPLAPTRAFPHSSSGDLDCVKILLQDRVKEKDIYRQSYVDLERTQYDFLQPYFERTMPPEFKDSVPTFDDVVSAVAGESANEEIFAVNAFTAALFPNVKYGSKLLEIGALADMYIPSNWSPPAELEAFLAKHSKPICVGYGSMPFAQVATILEALEACQRPAVLVGSCMVDYNDDDKSEWARKHTFCVPSVPYPWLLPKCRMMLCHGGAGVVHAALRAGVPPVISPLMGDQFFFAELLSAKGLGVRASAALVSMKTDELIDAIENKAPACMEACQVLRKRMNEKEPNGAASLAKIIMKK